MIVKVPGVGTVLFPDDMEKAEVEKAIDRHLHAPPKGMIEPGNIDLNNRPIVHNDDGTHSSEYSISSADEKGREVLVPTIVDGRFLTPNGKKPREGSKAEKAMFKEAWKHYEETGEHLGIFDTPENANTYSESVHARPIVTDDAKSAAYFRMEKNRTNKPLFVVQANSSTRPQQDSQLPSRMNTENAYEGDSTMDVSNPTPPMLTPAEQ